MYHEKMKMVSNLSHGVVKIWKITGAYHILLCVFFPGGGITWHALWSTAYTLHCTLSTLHCAVHRVLHPALCTLCTALCKVLWLHYLQHYHIDHMVTTCARGLPLHPFPIPSISRNRMGFPRAGSNPAGCAMLRLSANCVFCGQLWISWPEHLYIHKRSKNSKSRILICKIGSRAQTPPKKLITQSRFA